MEESTISLRGWDFPHTEDPRINRTEWIGAEINWGRHKEFWRLYLSGQFVHYSAMFEDFDPVNWTSSGFGGKGRPDRYLEIISTLYKFTEILTFASRVSERLYPEDGAHIAVTLFDTGGRDLVFWDMSRFLGRRYICEEGQVSVSEDISAPQLISEAGDVALSLTLRVFELFNWIDPPREIFEEDQRKLLERRQ